jgi:hypothetical protein
VTAEDPILGELLSDTRPVVRQLLSEPLRDPATLRDAVDAYLARVRQVDPLSVADRALGEALARRCGALLARWDELDGRGRHLVQAAALYFVLEDDGDGDLESPFGFDDDLEVFNAVAKALGEPPLAPE